MLCMPAESLILQSSRETDSATPGIAIRTLKAMIGREISRLQTAIMGGYLEGAPHAVQPTWMSRPAGWPEDRDVGIFYRCAATRAANR